MRQRVNIEELEQSTKIRAKYLRALENEEFGLLPGPTYVKSFLRTYAEKLGLDPHVLVEEYRAQYEPEPVDFQPIASSPRDTRRRPPSPRFGPGAAIAAAALALVTFLLILGLTGGEDDEPERDADSRPAETTPREKKPPRKKPPAPRPAKRVEMRVIPAAPTYVCIDRGPEEIVFEGTLTAARTFRAPRTLRINLGKRSAQLRVNGRPVRFEDGPDPVGFEFTRGGRREELPLGERPCA
jgi:cytoskeletal protein RodZ